MFRSLAILGCIAFLSLQLVAQSADDSITEPRAQKALAPKVERDENGLYTLVTPRLTLVTDIPIDDELRSWPDLIEQSIGQWKLFFGVNDNRMLGLHLNALLIGDRERLTSLGKLDGVPAFDEGYQFGNEIYLREQPTAYYRRHLFLHEATHWMIWRLYGGGGSPWFMEGMAEMQGTHALQNGILKLGVIPASREQVSGWGRLRMIDETLKKGVAPSLSEILAYGNNREDHEIRYSWSWAATVFFTNHPRYNSILKELYSDKLDYSERLSVNFKKRLKADWNNVEVDWAAFVSDLDFGYDLQRSRVVSQENPNGQKLQVGSSTTIRLACDRGWQFTGVVLEAGKQIQISCSENYVLRNAVGSPDSNWAVGSQGISYEYYRGNPLGCVIASVATPQKTESTQRWKTVRVGAETVFTPSTAGELYLKVNEPSKGLGDNYGNLSVQISVSNE